MDVEITKNTSHEIVLRGWTLPGRLQLVQSVIPVEVKIKSLTVVPETPNRRGISIRAYRTSPNS